MVKEWIKVRGGWRLTTRCFLMVGCHTGDAQAPLATGALRYHLDTLPVDYDLDVSGDRFLAGLAFMVARQHGQSSTGPPPQDPQGHALADDTLARDVILGLPFMREIDKGLAKTRIGLVLITPAFLKRIESGGVSEKELSELLARDLLIPVAHGVTYDEISGDQPAPRLPQRSQHRRGLARRHR